MLLWLLDRLSILISSPSFIMNTINCSQTKFVAISCALLVSFSNAFFAFLYDVLIWSSKTGEACKTRTSLSYWAALKALVVSTWTIHRSCSYDNHNLKKFFDGLYPFQCENSKLLENTLTRKYFIYRFFFTANSNHPHHRNLTADCT